MATLTLTIPNAQLSRVADAICEKFGYTGFEPDGITPQTKQEFVRKILIKYLKKSVAEHEAGNAGAAAFKAVELDVENNVSIT